MLRLQSELTYASRVNTMGELAASLAHELNQPLAAILNNAEAIQSMLESENPHIDEIKAGITDIIDDDTRASDTIRRVRSLFKREKLTESTLDIRDVLEGISRIVQNDAIIRKIVFGLDVQDGLPQVMADRVQLQQAIINFILNAFDAVTDLKEGARKVQVSAMASVEGGVTIHVMDTGKGMEPALARRIFEPFFTTKPRGMGMGLAISKSILEAHGGQVSVSSSCRIGTTFAIQLPQGSLARV